MRLPSGLPTNCVRGYGHWGVPRTATGAPGGSGKVLSRSRRPGSNRARGNGSEGARSLVRTTARGVAGRAVDRGCSRDPHEAGAQAEDGSPGCGTDSAIAAGRSLSAGLGAELGESRSAATAVASAPHGAGAHADHEPVASGGAQRGTALQEAAMAGRRTRATGVVPVSVVGEPATARSTGAAGPTDFHDCRVDAGHRARSGEMSRGAAVADASRSGRTDSAGLRADHRPNGAVPVRQADRELSGAGALGGVQRAATTVGPYHETGQLSATFPAGGSGASHGSQRSGVAQQVLPPGDATGTKDRQGRHGAETRRSDVLDVAQGMELRAVEKVRFARGRARKSRWCAVEHRVIDWVSRSPSRGSSK